MKEKIMKVIKSPIIYILIICVFIQIKIYNNAVNEYVLTPDSHSYYEEYKGGSILKGEIDSFRTPVYPYFIKMLKLFSTEENLYKNVVFAQKLLYLVSILLVYLIMIKITKNKAISSIISMIIGICPYLVLFNTLVLTEALSIFEIVFLMYVTTLYICKPRKITAAIIGVIILGMIMTRPGFIYMIPIYALFWILKYLFNRSEKKYIITGLISIAICSIFVLMYCGQMKHLYGNFMLSRVTFTNDLVSIAEAKSYTEASDSEIKRIMEETKTDVNDEESSWLAAGKVYHYPYEQKNAFIKEAKYNKKYLKYLIDKSLKLAELKLVTLQYTIPKEKTFINHLSNIIIPLNFAEIYLLLLFIMCYLIYRLFKYVQIDWFLAMVFVFILANLFTLIVGAPFEEQRLFIVSVIPTIICIGYILSKVVDKEEKIDQENNLFYKFFIEKTNNSIIQFIRYFFVGGLAAVVNIGGLYILSGIFGIQYLLANVIAFILGLITNYKLSKLLVFTDNSSMNKFVEFLTYCVIGILGLGFDTGFMWLFTEKINFYFMISKIISTGLVFIWNFIARKIMYIIINKFRRDN